MCHPAGILCALSATITTAPSSSPFIRQIEICRADPYRISVATLGPAESPRITLRLRCEPPISGPRRNLQALLCLSLLGVSPCPLARPAHLTGHGAAAPQPLGPERLGTGSSGNASQGEVSDSPTGLTSRRENCGSVFGLLLRWSELYSNNSNNKSGCSSRRAVRK